MISSGWDWKEFSKWAGAGAATGFASGGFVGAASGGFLGGICYDVTEAAPAVWEAVFGGSEGDKPKPGDGSGGGSGSDPKSGEEVDGNYKGGVIGSGGTRFPRLGPVVSRKIDVIISHDEFVSGGASVTVIQTDTGASIILDFDAIDALKVDALTGDSKRMSMGINPITGETRSVHLPSMSATSLAQWEWEKNLCNNARRLL